MPLSQFSDQLIHDQFNSTQYELLHKIGEGGFGKVFKAIQANTGQPVAIKFLAIEPHCDEQQKKRYIERFKRETALSSQLQHPNIVRLLDKGQINDNLLYGVFEYVEGRSLREHLIQEGALNAVDAKEVMLQVLDALVHAHQNGIVHRDIKPANIMLSKTGAKTHAKILDFGIGTLTQDSRQADFNTLTLTQETLGTPSYSAPEQLRGEPATEKTDLYVWGLVFLECLTGLPAITGSSIAAVYHKQLSDMQVSIPSTLLGHPIADLLRRVLIKNATDRVITGETLYQEVSQVNMTNLVGVLADYRAQQHADDDTMIMRNDGPASASMQNFTAHIERKQITVLAMRLSTKVLTDKELDLDIVDTLFRSQRNHCIDIATRYGATHVGNLADSVLFYFGYPIASDNDTRLCARTILDAISDISRRNALTQEAHGVQINVHAGIHSGVFTTYATAMPEGHIANTAMALAREAGERQILCSEESRTILDPYSEFEYFGEKLLNHHVSKERIFSLTGERRVEAFGFMRGTRNSHELVGRSNELEQSLLIFNHEKTENRFTHIHGEAGIGKSRLLQEIRSNAARYQHLVAQCLPEHQNNALYPILTLVRYLYNTNNLTTAEAIETFTSIITKHDNTLDCKQTLPILLIWLNIALNDELTASTLAPDAQKALLFQTLSALLMSQSVSFSVSKLYIVEDIHWADVTTIEFMQHFAKQLHNGDVLISTSRQKVPTELKDLTLIEVGLKKLTERATEDFIVKLFDNQAVSQSVLDVLVNRTDGIPLFIEELIDMLKQKSLVSVINGEINFTSPDKLDQVPTSLRESLQQKLDNLIHAKETAQLAATIGREFEYELLVAASSLSENQIQNDLNELIAKDLIIHQRHVNNDSYIFKHALVRDAAYESTNTSNKEKNHNKIADILVSKSYLEALLVAHHYKHAKKFLLSSTYAFKAADHTYEGSLYKEAFNITNEYFQIAQKISDENESIKWQLRLNSYNISSLMLGFGYGDVRIFEKAKQNEELLRQSNGSLSISIEEYQRLRHQLIWSQISYHNNNNERTKAIALAEEALIDKTHKASYLHRLLTQSMLANNYVFDAQLDKAEQSLYECFALLGQLNPEEIRNGLKTYGLLPNCLPYYFNSIFQAIVGQSEKAIESIELAIKVSQKFNHLPSYLMALNYASIVSYICNETTFAKVTIERARQEFKSDSHLYLVFLPTDALNAWLNQDTDLLKNICEQIEQTGQVHSLSFYKTMYIDTLIESKQIDRASTQLSELTAWCETQNEKIMLNKLKELKNGIC
ncbi:TOMM system kinase/cyclase fusion protein [Pseudoalteromonas sp. SS15]|uniref:TOMM system kinase/cyclase fusion protein n=1 Tax=Pseudoalteromonas sp. SS15 TaxID=3139393 RepID=UPI003BAB22E8